MAPTDILSALQDPLYTGADTYSGIGANAVSRSLPMLVDPYGSASGNALNVFGGSILAALLGSMAKSDAADENAKIVAQQSTFMNANPEQRLAMAKENPAVFAKLQSALGVNDINQQAQDKAFTRQLELQKPFEVAKENRALENRVKELNQLKLAESQLYGNDPLQNPESPQYKVNKEKEDRLITIRKEFNTLPAVQNFAKASQAANALAGALKDDSKVSDQELVRYSILMIEPGMAVREGEQGAVRGSQSIPDAWRGQLESALSGKTSLGDDVREGIKNLASRAYTSHKNIYDQANQLYSKEATLQGLDPSRLSYMGSAPDASSVFGGSSSADAQRAFAQKALASGMSKEEARAAWAAQGGQ